MNRYFMIRRLRGPVFLLTIGVMALLKEMHLLRFGQTWPLLLILAGVLLLAERTALANEELYPPTPFPGAAPARSTEQPVSAIVPAHQAEQDNVASHHAGGEQ